MAHQKHFRSSRFSSGMKILFILPAIIFSFSFPKNSYAQSFTKVTQGAIVNDDGYSEGCGWGGYDNDCYPDLLVANWTNESNLLYKNNGDGTFSKITTGPVVNNSASSLNCSWGDYDNDGHLDLFVANFNSQTNFLYKNNGNGTFTQITTGPIGGRVHVAGDVAAQRRNEDQVEAFARNR